MVAKLGFHRGLGGLAFGQLAQRFAELWHVAGRVGPIQVATLGAGASIFGLLFGDVVELAAFFQAGDDGHGFSFFVHQDVAGFEFLAAIRRGKLVVLCLQVGFSHGVFLLEVGEQLTDHDGLAGQLHLHLEVFATGQAAFFSFLHENFAGDDFLAQLALHLRGDRTAGFGHLLRNRVNTRFRHSLAVDDGDVLRQRRQGGQSQQASHHGDE